MDKKDSRKELMRQIKDEILGLSSLPLYKERKRNKVFPVIGEGNHYTKIMFIGEAPGKNEALTGRPFCGASGRVLDELLKSIKINRGDIYITNIVKDRPPSNRDPSSFEIDAYSPFLDRQLNIIQPRTIVTLGRFSMSYILNKFKLDQEIQSISKIHGRVYEADASYGKINIIPMYHPAVAVYNANMKAVLGEDFKVLLK
jgi:uracil-DNA glycosylase